MSRSGLRTWTIAAVAALLAGAGDLGAQRARGMARTSVTRSASLSGNFNRNIDVNRGVGVNRNVNANINRDINVDRDVDVDVDHRYGGYGYGCCYHPVARAAAATTAAVATAAAVGSVVYSLPPSCAAVNVNGFTYQQCGSTWYQPQFSGSSVTYVVVNPPR